MKLSHAHRAIQDGWVMVERSDRMWFTGEGDGVEGAGEQEAKRVHRESV